MGFLYLAGAAANLVTTASSYSSTNENTNFPNEDIGSGFPNEPFIFNAAGANDTVTIDLGSSKSASMAGIHGHNLDSNVTTIELRKSTNNFSGNDVLVATFSLDANSVLFKPTAWVTFTSTSSRYWRLEFTGTNASPIAIGEWSLGPSATLTQEQLIEDYSYKTDMPQTRNRGNPSPQVYVVTTSDLAQRTYSMAFQALTLAARDEVDQMFKDSLYGEEQFVFIPDDSDGGRDVVHARLPQSYDWQHIPTSDGAVFKTFITVEEDPFFKLGS